MNKQKVDHMHFGAAEMVASIGRLRLDLDAFTMIAHVILWFLLALVTAGFGLLIIPYAAAKLILNSIIITDEFGRVSARLRCEISWTTQIGHGAVWALFVLLSGGIAAPFYIFALAQMAINRTELVSI